MWYNKGSLPNRGGSLFVFEVKEVMNEDKIHSNVEAALNAEEFDVLNYLEDQPVATDVVKIYTHVGDSRRLKQLAEQRDEILYARKAKAQRDDYSDLSIADEDQDTELDDEINEILERLEKTALIFHMKTVAPALIRAIEKAAEAKAQSDWTHVQAELHRQRTTADILARAIDHVERGDGAVDPNAWTADRLLKVEESLYAEQAQRLISALYEMVYTGQVFEEALTVDF